MQDSELVETVRRGYDVLSLRYRGDCAGTEVTTQYAPWVQRVVAATPPGGAVLDLGCGNGIPVAAALAGHGLRVTGVDVSAVMVDRAKRLVPSARFVRGDASDPAEVDFTEDSFDAVVSFYALIHLPPERMPGLLQRVARWLRPDGLLVATVGHDAWTGVERGWLGSSTDMAWSHPDGATFRAWCADAGFKVSAVEHVPEGDGGGHDLVVCTREDGRRG